MNQEPAKRLAALYEIGQLLNSTLDLDEVLKRVMDSFIQVTGAERGFIMLLGEQNGELEFKVARNLERETIEAPSFQVSRNLVQQVAHEGKPLLVTDALGNSTMGAFASVAQLRLRSVLAVPLRTRERIIGVAYADHRAAAGLFSEEDMDLFQAFAGQAAIAIENARLHQRLLARMQEITVLKDYQENILRSVASGIVTCDPEGSITSFNPAAEGIFGVSAEAALGKPYPQVFGEALSQQILGAMVRASAKGGDQVARREMDCLLLNRGRVPLQLGLSPLKDEAGKLMGLVITVDDLSEKRRLEEARRQEEERRQAEEAKRRHIEETIGRFVAPNVRDRLLTESDLPLLGGKRQEVTVLFADLRGFTSLSEQSSPKAVVDMLNQNLSLATKAILKYEGTLDKFMGDAVMAFFNAPLPQENHALQALQAAREMQQAIKNFPGSQASYGIGIHTGQAIVGTIGTPELMNYTVIGDAVNVAQRLQASAGPGETLLSEGTYDHVRGMIEAEVLEPLSVKGRAAPVVVYRLLGLKEAMPAAGEPGGS